jgi:hypothetical protein
MLKILIISITTAIIFSGCVADYFTLGKAQTYCEENGCDYSDAGVCSSPFDIIQKKEFYNKVAYKAIPCEQNKGVKYD